MIGFFSRIFVVVATLTGYGCDVGSASAPDPVERSNGSYELLWTVETGYDDGESLPAAFDEAAGLVYAFKDDTLRALTLESGQQVWTQWLDGRNTLFSESLFADEVRVYVQAVRSMAAFDKVTGEKLWDKQYGEERYDYQWANEMVELSDRLLAPGWNRVVVIDKATGNVIHEHELLPPPEAVHPLRGGRIPVRAIASSALSTDRATLYLASEYSLEQGENPDGRNPGKGGTVYAFDLASGRILWEHEAPQNIKRTNPFPGVEYSNHTSGFVGVAAAAGRVFAVGGEFLTALDAATGEVLWRFSPPGGYASHTLVADGERVYAGATDGNLIAVDAATGEEVWRDPTYTSMIGHAPILYGERLFFVAGSGGGLFVYDRRTGERLFRTGAPQPSGGQNAREPALLWSPPRIGGETLVVVGTRGVYAWHVGPPE
jgi:outer membrane protein assembly factor BamB